MAIFKNSHLIAEKNELDSFYRRLSNALNGCPGAANLAPEFHCSIDQFSSEYVDIDLEELNRAIAHFKVVVDELKALKKKAALPIHRA